MTNRAVLLVSALLLAGCSSVTPAPTASTPVASTPVPATATLSVFIPSASGFHAQYVPTTTTGLRVRLGTYDKTFPVGAAQPGCTAVTGGVSCTFTLTVSAGADQTLRLDALDAANHVLSTSTQTVTVVKGQNNAFDVLLTGVAAAGLGSLTPTSRPAEVTAATGSAILDRGGAFSFGVALRDASGQIIVNPGLPTFTVCSTNAAFTVAGAATTTPVVTAPEPTGAAQTTTLFIPADGNCSTTANPLASTALTVPAFTLEASVPATIVAGSSAVTTAQLYTAKHNLLTVAGRTVGFSTSAGSVSAASDVTDSTGQASVNVIAPTTITTGTVTASSAGVSGTASFTTVAGTANATTSTLTVTPDTVFVGGSSTVTVTLKDANGNPVTTAPTLTGTNGVTIGAAMGGAAVNNVFTFPVTAPTSITANPTTVVFTAKVGGNTVGTGTLTVNANPVVITVGGQPIPPVFDFSSGGAQTFTLSQPGSTGVFTSASSNPGVATATITNGVLTVTPIGAGVSTITITDQYGQTVTFDVTVTTVSITVH
ncbi:hypothetical protein E7T09_00970 [Deinococcus sp. KSM4-11]|uniref:hypothetical protein n=1 Tax=Deinococcus sp. KSM4-11 TaxID=2568654 RepID=UPI0010A3B2A1|nr:hypothetical protein [Deinococcus sp. KSM4-11]THF87840.1 hypothetical protein E7T09_00970 [Deinococcus sp. KSM4-11]